MEKQPIEVPADLLEEFGQSKDGYDFGQAVGRIMSVKAEDVPDADEIERRPVRGRPRKTA